MVYLKMTHHPKCDYSVTPDNFAQNFVRFFLHISWLFLSEITFRIYVCRHVVYHHYSSYWKIILNI